MNEASRPAVLRPFPYGLRAVTLRSGDVDRGFAVAGTDTALTLAGSGLKYSG